MIDAAIAFIILTAAFLVVTFGIPGLMIGIVLLGLVLTVVVAALTFAHGLWSRGVDKIRGGV